MLSIALKGVSKSGKWSSRAIFNGCLVLPSHGDAKRTKGLEKDIPGGLFKLKSKNSCNFSNFKQV